MMRRAPVVAMLFSLAWAATAHAECAWIVWRNSVALRPGSHLNDNWFPEEAVNTHQTCDAIVNAKNASEGRASDLALKAGARD